MIPSRSSLSPTHTPLGQRCRTTVYFGLAFIIQPKYRTHVCTGPRETVKDFLFCYKDTLLQRSYTTSQRCGRQFTLSRLELILQPQTYALLYVMMMRRRRIRMMTVVLHETALFRKGPAAGQEKCLHSSWITTPNHNPEHAASHSAGFRKKADCITSSQRGREGGGGVA